MACTHVGWLDILYLGLAVWPREIHYMAKEELFRNKRIGAFLRKINAFPVNRSNPGPSSLKIPFQLLGKGEIVGIFPTGTRTTEEVSLKRGAVTIAARSGGLVVPCAYSGPSSIKFSDLFRRKRAVISFGKPISCKIEGTKEEAEQLRNELLLRLNEEMAALQKALSPNK